MAYWWWLRYQNTKWADLPEKTRRDIVRDSIDNPQDVEAQRNGTVGRRLPYQWRQQYAAEHLEAEQPQSVSLALTERMEQLEMHFNHLTGTFAALRTETAERIKQAEQVAGARNRFMKSRAVVEKDAY